MKVRQNKHTSLGDDRNGLWLEAVEEFSALEEGEYPGKVMCVLFFA